MNAWKREPKKNTTYTEQNRQRATINQADRNMVYPSDRNPAVRGTGLSNDQRTSTGQNQRGCPTRLRVRAGELDIQWLD